MRSATNGITPWGDEGWTKQPQTKLHSVAGTETGPARNRAKNWRAADRHASTSRRKTTGAEVFFGASSRSPVPWSIKGATVRISTKTAIIRRFRARIASLVSAPCRVSRVESPKRRADQISIRFKLLHQATSVVCPETDEDREYESASQQSVIMQSRSKTHKAATWTV